MERLPSEAEEREDARLIEESLKTPPPAWEKDPLDDFRNDLAFINGELQMGKLTPPKARWRAIRRTIAALKKHPNETETIIINLAILDHDLNPPVEKLVNRYLPGKQVADLLSDLLPPSPQQ